MQLNLSLQEMDNLRTNETGSTTNARKEWRAMTLWAGSIYPSTMTKKNLIASNAATRIQEHSGLLVVVGIVVYQVPVL